MYVYTIDMITVVIPEIGDAKVPKYVFDMLERVGVRFNEYDKIVTSWPLTDTVEVRITFIIERESFSTYESKGAKYPTIVIHYDDCDYDAGDIEGCQPVQWLSRHEDWTNWCDVDVRVNADGSLRMSDGSIKQAINKLVYAYLNYPAFLDS